MPTGFTPEQIAKLEEEFISFLPPEPTLADVDTAPKVKRLAFAGTELGILIHVDTGKAGKRNLFLNPLVARELIDGIVQGGEVQKWWAKVKDKTVALAPELTRADLEGAEQVRSLRTANVPKGILVIGGSERGNITFFLRPNFAAAVAWSVDETAKRALWWDQDCAIITVPTQSQLM